MSTFSPFPNAIRERQVYTRFASNINYALTKGSAISRCQCLYDSAGFLLEVERGQALLKIESLPLEEVYCPSKKYLFIILYKMRNFLVLLRF